MSTFLRARAVYRHGMKGGISVEPLMGKMFEIENSFRKEDGSLDWDRLTKFFREYTVTINTETLEVKVESRCE